MQVISSRQQTVQATCSSYRFQRGCLCASRVTTAAPVCRQYKQRRAVQIRAEREQQDATPPGESIESLFMKELKKRSIAGSNVAERPKESGTRTEPRDASEPGARSRQGMPSPPPMFGDMDDSKVPPQLRKSRELNSEGLEGLIPRGTELLKLGGSFFLAFLPYVLVASVVFTGIYLVFGESFIHGGHSVPPHYVDPYDLLSEPTVDPMVPLR
ncbi:hypothetical protein WJX72_011124 [[Myrmecia] bisecta]|uniref:Uncharacterized protein n=1 Tax=[Myrmecia] bisecta TaxID=41462 RepID=A0AAW1PQ03_9CHLO